MKRKPDLRHVAEYAALLKRLGYSVAFGKIFGYLVAADPPCRCFDDIVADLKLSKGAVSMVLKTMEQHGYVAYLIKTGERKRYFHLSLSQWKPGLEQKIADSVRFTALLRKSLASGARRHREHRGHLRQLIQFETLFQNKMREIIATFSARKKVRAS